MSDDDDFFRGWGEIVNHRTNSVFKIKDVFISCPGNILTLNNKKQEPDILVNNSNDKMPSQDKHNNVVMIT